MKKLISGNAEVALKYPNNLDIGTFERSVDFDVHPDQSGVSLTLHRTSDTGIHKSIRMHFQYALFADILADLATTAAAMPWAGRDHQIGLRNAAEALRRALDSDMDDKQAGTNKSGRRRLRQEYGVANLTPEEEVLLLHVLE